TRPSFREFEAIILQKFFHQDHLEKDLQSICAKALNFEIPLRELKKNNQELELFHGPTLAFKDIGARFLAYCLEKIVHHQKSPLKILVATSGDTGAAVASAFYKRKNIEVILLFPKGRVSKRQEIQLCCWGENIKSYRIAGSFDDCQ